MKKNLITLAVAGALVAPSAFAETTLYGRLDTSLNYLDTDDVVLFDEDGNSTSVAVSDENFWDVSTNTTRIGVKGSEDLGNGLKAIFQAEWAFSSSEGGSTAGGLRNRLAYAGLSGGWGTAAIGRQWTPYYGAVDKTDIFNNATYNATYLGTFRTGNAISYVTPNWNGFVAKAALVIDGGNTAKKSIDAYNLSAQYDNGPISLGLGYHRGYGVEDTEDTKVWGVAGSYNFGMAKIIAQYEDMERPSLFDPTDKMDWKEWNIAAEGYFGNNTIRGQFGNLDYDLDDDNIWAVGWQYNFSKRTRTYVEYGDITGISRENVEQVAVGSSKIFTAGFRHDF